MKVLLPLMLALFPFLHDEKYEVTLQTCEPNRIVVETDGTPFEITLFNTKITDEVGWNQTCSALKNAKKIEIEIDSTSAIQEPLPVYLFADTHFVQEDLVREEHAYTLIHNPEYTYEKQLLEIEQSNQTMAQTDGEQGPYPYPAQGWKFLAFLLLSWLGMLLYVLYKKDKLHLSKPLDKF